MRYLVPALLALALTQGCIVGSGAGQTDINLDQARDVSDSFMGGLVNDRVDVALDKMEPEFVEIAGRVKAEAEIRKLFDYCGRPLDQEFKRHELGARIDKNGKRPMRKFYYAATTSMHPKGICFFSVEVVPSGEHLKVASFGPLLLKVGQLPEWLK